MARDPHMCKVFAEIGARKLWLAHRRRSGGTTTARYGPGPGVSRRCPVVPDVELHPFFVERGRAGLA